jgi:glycosyltransferase involved in cell wall biosynthesis
MIEKAVDHVDLFLAPSKFSMERHRESGLRRPVAELPYFTSRWSEGRAVGRCRSSEAPYFLFVGRLEKIKGLQRLIPVFRRYHRAQLRIAGIGQYESALRVMAENSSNIKFLGRQSGEQLRVLYEQAVATIVPSIWYEVFGIVILESFSQKTPVIVSNMGGMPAVVDVSGGGFVFNTEEELVAAMDRLVDQPSLREQMGAQGHRALEEKWSADAHLRRYLGLIEEIALR